MLTNKLQGSLFLLNDSNRIFTLTIILSHVHLEVQGPEEALGWSCCLLDTE